MVRTRKLEIANFRGFESLVSHPALWLNRRAANTGSPFVCMRDHFSTRQE